jgi:hypothetical protein
MLFLLNLILLSLNEAKTSETISSANEPFIFNSTTSQFQMNTRAAKIPIFIKRNFDLSGAFLNSSSSKFIMATSIEYEKSAVNYTVPNGYALGFINLDANLVGKDVVEVVYFQYVKNQFDQLELLKIVSNHTVIVTTPSTTLDIILQVYGISFGIVVSLFMGILLDLNTILKIVKMPIPVVVGILSVTKIFF